MNRAPILIPAALIGLASLAPTSVAQEPRPFGYVYREPGSGWSSLRVHQALLKAPVTISPDSVWKFDPTTERWSKILPTRTESKVIRPQPRQIYSGKTDDVVLRLPREVGLFWVKWTEDGRPRGEFAFSGPMLCEDIRIGPPNKGDRVATCVPFPDRAVAAYVPDPQVFCR